MGSVAFGGEDENCKFPTMILDGCGAVNYASIPRKIRSAIKKRGRECTSPLVTSRRQHRASTTVDTLRKEAAKKSKLNKKQRRITKDEEEVAETLYALAGMFSDADQQKIDDQEDTRPTPQEETRKISSKATLGAVCPSNVVKSTAEVVSRTLEARQPKLFFSNKQAAKPLVSIIDMNPSGEEEIHLDQVAASGFEYGKNKYKDLVPSPSLSATRATSCETYKSCRLFEGTIFPSRPRLVENKISTEKHTRVAAEPNKSRKRCSLHVYISRLIKVLQISDRKEGWPIQPASFRNADSQILRTNGRNSNTYFSAIDLIAAENDSSETRKGILLRRRPVKDQQVASETSAKKGYDFLSLGTELCGLDTGENANGAGCFLEPPKQHHMPYTQNQSNVLCSLPLYGYSSSSHGLNSASAAQQVVQLSQYHSRRTGQQQKWPAQLYNTGGGGAPRLPPDWRNDTVLNSLFPHLLQLSPSQQQVMAINTTLALNRRRNLPFGFERNGTLFHPENMACNHHL